MLTFDEIGLCDNLVFERLHRRNNRVDIVAVAVAVACRSTSGGMKPKLIFSVVVFIKILILDFADTRDSFQVIFEFLINKLHEILSRHLILDVEFRLHFIQKRFFDSVGPFLTRESTDDSTPTATDAADAANFTCLSYEISRCFHRQRNTIPIHITKIITVAAWNHIRYTRITHPSPILSFVIQKSCFGCSDVVIFTRKSLS